jgi:hypothetical protein
LRVEVPQGWEFLRFHLKDLDVAGRYVAPRDSVTQALRTSRSGGDRRRCWSRSAATDAPAAVTSGAKTPRLLDMVEGRSKQAFKTWLADRP